MSTVGSIWHSSIANGNIAATNAYVLAQSVNIGFFPSTGPDANATTTVRGRIGSLLIRVDTIAGGANAITVRCCRDAAGDQPIMLDATVNISFGITTAAKGATTYKIDLPYVHADGNFWVFWKLNAGTAQVRTVEMIWAE